jgi:hypothetical protein
MATDRDEQQRQQQELEEIRRGFAEMGARMGSMFEPAEPEEPQRSPERSQKAMLPPAPPVAARSPFGISARPRRWAAALVLPFVAGIAFGYLLPKGDGGSDSPSSSGATTATSRARVAVPSPPATVIKTRTSVPETCVDTAKLADEVISRLTRNDRDNRLGEMLRNYTLASQACRREASP